MLKNSDVFTVAFENAVDYFEFLFAIQKSVDIIISIANNLFTHFWIFQTPMINLQKVAKVLFDGDVVNPRFKIAFH